MLTTLARLSDFWARRSLKFWLAIGMAMTFFPIFISAVTGYFLYHRTIIQPLVEVSSAQRHVLQPLQNLQLSLWTVSESVIDYAVDGQPQGAATYRHEADKVKAAFERLVPAASENRLPVDDVNTARDSWHDVAAIADVMVANKPQRADAAVGTQVRELEARMTDMNRHLATVHDDLRAENEHMHERALTDLVFVEELSLAGFVASVIFAVLGVILINRSLVSSMDQLARGAERLAAGDREHHVKVHLPHELVNVATAFNKMSKQILEQEKELERAAGTDGLTGLFNRRELDRILAEEIRRAERYGTFFSVIMVDIDHFKNFNDTHGHQAGDEALRSVAQKLRESVRDVDKACRFGGEEFILIMPACNAESARPMAERLRRAIEALPIILDEQRAERVTISLGISTYPDSGATSEALIKSADAALYVSKENGRNRVTSAIRGQ